jgi:hypothetical protein
VTLTFKTEPTVRIDIHLAGDEGVIRQACREFCRDNPRCVTVTGAAFVYTGGEEAGVCVGLRNYPRFPSTEEELWALAERLAEVLIERACQRTVLLVGDRQTKWAERKAEGEG